MLDNKIIGNRITEARKKINISQAGLAERLFISAQAVGKWERGESLPDIITLNRLAEIFGVDLNYFSAETEVSNESGKDFNSEMQPGPISGKVKNNSGWDMSRGNWLDADFSGLKNLHEKFSSSNMQRCKFIGSDMSSLLLRSNNVDACDFSGSDISNSHIRSSNMQNCIFRDCSLMHTEFAFSNISGCDFTGADLSGLIFKAGGFEKNTLTNAKCYRSSFINSHIADMVFEGTLEDCSFENCNFTKVSFNNVTLFNTFFKNNSKLKRIKFIDCKADRITYEFLKQGKADLTGITLLAI
ncbi:MAG TPA: pentapeptide repeat-containing protein [Lentimicrobium sp.]|nr:pentapeptide repeat-containing protein [Lentimicrobium sp.]